MQQEDYGNKPSPITFQLKYENCPSKFENFVFKFERVFKLANYTVVNFK